jgi:hypothetical protein
MVTDRSENVTLARVSATSGAGWYEVRPFFEKIDEKYADMYEVVKRIREFSFFIVRSADGLFRLFMHMPDPADAKVAQAALMNAFMEPSEPKMFSAAIVVHLKMRRHYALPIARELVLPVLYATIEKIGRPCFVALTAKHSDESYRISKFVEKNTYDKPPLWRDILGMFGSGTSSENPKRRISPQRLMLAELAKEKQKLRHFQCSIAVGAQDFETAKSVTKSLCESDAFAIASMERDSMYKAEVKKPLFFSSRFCVLSDIELANIISLPADPRIHRFNISKKETYTSGPSKENGEL